VTPATMVDGRVVGRSHYGNLGIGAPGRLRSLAMAEIRAEITANVWQVVVEEGQMVAEGDEICILESMKMEIPVITEVPGVVRELHVAPEQTVQEGDLIAVIDES
jgi:acetyl-CoA carboxylase biotin carboxyl carrier protein